MSLISALGLLTGCLVGARAPRGPAPRAGDPELAEILRPVHARHRLPALACAVLDGGEAGEVRIRAAVVGYRKLGDPTPVALTDRFHLGSCTKAMTAALAADLVEEGRLEWRRTLAESLPDLVKPDSPWAKATVEQLLVQTAGFPEESAPQGKSLLDIHGLSGTPAEQREAYCRMILAQRPPHEPGRRHVYSNAGYTVAGLVVEKAGGKPFEELLRARLFGPLGMTTAGFGPPGSGEAVDEPWAHQRVLAGLRPVRPGKLADNPVAITPAGRVHASIEDWARFARIFVGGPADPLKRDSILRLLTPPPGEEYAMGWVAVERDWGGGTVYTHAGSNTLNYCVAWLAPKKRWGVLIATNAGGQAAARACDEVAADCARRLLRR